MLEHKHHLPTTNDAPSSIVAVLFSQKLKDINDQIAKLQQACQNCLIVLAPIRHLPLEIFSAIFTETLSPEDLTTLQVKGPLSLLKYKEAKRWLGRSAELPKTLVVQNVAPDPWLKDYWSKNSSQTELRAWNNLQWLDLTFSSWGKKEEDNPKDSIFRHLPLVTTFALELPSYCNGEDCSLVFHLSPNFLCNLTHLTLWCNWDKSKIMGTLQHCMNLESLKLDFCSTLEEYLAQTPSTWLDALQSSGIHLVKLRRMDPVGILQDTVEIALRYIKASALEELDLDFESEGQGRGSIVVECGCRRRLEALSRCLDVEDIAKATNPLP
ncbi:hypothetical protein FA13DRAFT_1719484 [Coprinellus micaceus]|uniref:F-box domain-containing protein n=1 Tax=Coprinellus micaceus TaxID=71717 RepID=A0A4Y7SBT1_COPMI|nr:hypothetical protein FA13DRAFT_1719484 [Coprinellus micaceus]